MALTALTWSGKKAVRGMPPRTSEPGASVLRTSGGGNGTRTRLSRLGTGRLNHWTIPPYAGNGHLAVPCVRLFRSPRPGGRIVPRAGPGGESNAEPPAFLSAPAPLQHRPRSAAPPASTGLYGVLASTPDPLRVCTHPRGRLGQGLRPGRRKGHIVDHGRCASFPMVYPRSADL